MDRNDRPDTSAMTRDELIKECRRLGVNPRGGLSRARRDDLESWVSINWRPRHTRETSESE